MRKATAIAACAVMFNGGMALAGDPDIGCGWGTLAFRGQEGAVRKILGATTNGSLGSQTFGISSGTAGCSRGGVIRADAALGMYAGANIDALAHDMAAGRGEALDTLAHLLGIAPADRPAFARLVRARFGELFGADEVSAGEMLTTLKGLMAADARLSQYGS